MTSYEFNNLERKIQSDLIMEWGFFISKKKRDGQIVAVFALNNFFVEMLFEENDPAPLAIRSVTERRSNMEYFSDLKKYVPFLECRLKSVFLLEPIHKVHPFI